MMLQKLQSSRILAFLKFLYLKHASDYNFLFVNISALKSSYIQSKQVFVSINSIEKALFFWPGDQSLQGYGTGGPQDCVDNNYMVE